MIQFQDWPLDRVTAPQGYTGPVAADFSECLDIVQRLVKPERAEKKRDAYRRRWWQFAELQTCAYEATRNTRYVLVKARVSPIHALVFIANGQVFNEKVVVFRGGFGEFALLQSSVHEAWAVEYSPTMGVATLSYSPSACVSTFPFVAVKQSLADLGKTYHDHRGEIMIARGEGLTKTYNHFHDKEEQSEDFRRMRSMHAEIDRAVVSAYGWSEIDLGHGFHKTKQGVRYTLSESARRSVLDRLLVLNHHHYEEEGKAASHVDKNQRGGQRAMRNPAAAESALPGFMFGAQAENFGESNNG